MTKITPHAIECVISLPAALGRHVKIIPKLQIWLDGSIIHMMINIYNAYNSVPAQFYEKYVKPFETDK